MKKINFLILTVFAAQLLSASYADQKREKIKDKYKHDTFNGPVTNGNVNTGDISDHQKADK